ncbi:ribonucleotide-diphosphate reductase subunit alpha, partial [Patescibacteria group bacterium]|nr:ribonucleotide-diphosphate reductase subunit alpha [Patescibacteria group bacterium]
MRISQDHKDHINKNFSENALRMMQKRYLLPYDEGGQETPADMFERVANAIAGEEKNYGHDEEFVETVAKDFFEIMANKEYTPAGRTLTNAGGKAPVIANCIVLPIHDSMESIFQTLKDAAMLQQAGC